MEKEKKKEGKEIKYVIVKMGAKEVLKKMMRAVEEETLTDLLCLIETDPRLVHISEMTSKKTPLHHACYLGNDPAVELLIEKGAQINAKTKFSSRTPLHVAAISNQPDTVKLLLKLGADVDALTNDKSTALSFACHNGNTDVVNVLLAHGANPSSPNIMKSTPVHFAAFKGDLEILKMLHQHGADLEARNIQGETPLDYAFEAPALQYLWRALVKKCQKTEVSLISWLSEDQLEVLFSLVAAI